MEVKVRDADILAEHRAGCLQVPVIGSTESCFVILGAEEVDCVSRSIFFRDLRKMSVEGWLRGLRAGYLDALTKCLQSLLFPEYCLAMLSNGSCGNTNED
jgi:hypothetical protein